MGFCDDCNGVLVSHLSIFCRHGLQELFTRKHPFEGINSRAMIVVRILSGMPDRPYHMDDEWWDLVCTPCWESDPARRPNMMTLIHNIEVGKAMLDHGGWRLSIAESITVMASSRNPLMKYQVLYKFGVLRIVPLSSLLTAVLC